MRSPAIPDTERHDSMRPRQLDHVAVRVADRDATTARLTEALDVHVVERNDRLTLVGATATAGKLTLFDAPEGGPLAGGILVALLLTEPDGHARDPIELDGGVRIEFGTHGRVGADVPRHALVGATLMAEDPAATAREYVTRYGFQACGIGPETASVAAGSGVLTIVRGAVPADGLPVLDHIGLLVDSSDAHEREAAASDISVLDVVDAANARAVFLDGPSHVRLEYVEHKPEFALV